jgi:phosphonopyruvate decarboxylase
MIDPGELIRFMEKRFQYISGVPCSYFKDFLAYLTSSEAETQLRHIYATREDEAIGIASGVALSGKRALVYMQNSGLGNIGDALTSLAQLYKLPILMLISYRGLEEDQDFPEHSLMGEVNEPVLKALKVPYWNLSEKWEKIMNRAVKEMEEKSTPVALLVKKGVLSH